MMAEKNWLAVRASAAAAAAIVRRVVDDDDDDESSTRAVTSVHLGPAGAGCPRATATARRSPAGQPAVVQSAGAWVTGELRSRAS
uniref:Uncharacterized protein n=1 Tax=Leersia perrieri TaxID=77586 RepID=A0A0D9XX26_9ORYZ